MCGINFTYEIVFHQFNILHHEYYLLFHPSCQVFSINNISSFLFFPLIHVCLTSPLPLATPKEPTPKRLAKSVTQTHLDLTIYNSCEGLFFQILRQVKSRMVGPQVPYKFSLCF